MKFQKGKSGNPATQFKPGQSGNPAGAKPGWRTFRARIKEFADKEIDYKDLEEIKVRINAGDAVIMALFAKALYKGDMQAARIILEHADGKNLSLGGDPENPILLENVKPDLTKYSDAELKRLAGISGAIADDAESSSTS